MLICGCSSKVRDYDSIELISYNWCYWNDAIQKDSSKLLFKYSLYSLTDDDGNSSIYFQRYYPNKKILYFKITIDTSIIREFIKSAKTYSEKIIDLNTAPPIIYDGPCLKLRINYFDKTSKTINFIDTKYEKQDIAFYNYYHFIMNKFDLETYEILTDTIDFTKRRDEFIHFSIHNDTTSKLWYLFPPPPPPVEMREKIKFTGPIIIK
jgi:hypothetical protein